MEFEPKLSSVKIGRNKSDKQVSKIENITKCYKFCNFKMVDKAAYDSKHRKDLKK